MRTCASCGASIEPTSRFCADCGAAVGAVVPPPGTTDALTATSPPPSTPTPTPPSYHGSFEPGTRLGTRYRIVGLLGRGGMGEVYRADDLELNQPVALKFLPGRGATAAELDRLRKEVRIAREVSHPNVCRTYDISTADGQIFLVMEYIDGEDLASVLRRLGRPSRDKAVEIARQLCLGLGAAHEGGILHRDLKPANVMIDGRGRVRITDFGLADLAEELAHDRSGSGTPAYMAPEQLAGGAASVQSDLYSLGLVLYELFTGKRAYDSHNVAEIRRLQSDSSIRSPSSLIPDIDPAVERVVMRCLEPDPRGRPGSAYAVLGALPGGDPLAAALAAGETPSPELVANASVAGSLKPGIAIACVAFVLASFGWWAASEQGRVRAFTRSDTALALRAEDVLVKAGVTDPPRHTYSGFTPNFVYVARKSQVDSIAAARGAPRAAASAEALYWRRWSPGALNNPDLHDPRVRLFEPPQALPGSATVLTDLDGRLVSIQVIPSAEAAGSTTATSAADSSPANPAGPGAASDWSALVSAAGYDASRMTRIAPGRSPAVKTDSVTAWSVPGQSASEQPMTLLAGWLDGRVVHFSVDAIWGSSFDPFAFRSPDLDEAPSWIYLLFWVVFPLVGGVFFAIRNLRAGRGDRRGATRLAVLVFVGYLMEHLVVLNVPQLGIRRALGDFADQAPIGHALLHGVSVWFMYVALEPYVRRFWPRVLVSWARLVSGRYRDPIIGRDVLVGFVFAGVVATARLAANALADRMGSPTPRGINWNALDTLAGTGPTLASVLFLAAVSVLVVMGFFTMLLIARLVLRGNKPAIVGVMLMFGALMYQFASDLGPLRAGISAAVWSIGTTYVGLRFGLLAALVGGFVGEVLEIVPWTTDLSVWYSSRMLLVGGLLAGLLIYGFMIALAGRAILRDPIHGSRGPVRQA